MVKNKANIVRVDALPTVDGDPEVVYIYNNEGFVWDGTECVSLSKSADLVTLENQIAELETQLGNKADVAGIDEKIETAVEAAIEEAISVDVVEF